MWSSGDQWQYVRDCTLFWLWGHWSRWSVVISAVKDLWGWFPEFGIWWEKEDGCLPYSNFFSSKLVDVLVWVGPKWLEILSWKVLGMLELIVKWFIYWAMSHMRAHARYPGQSLPFWLVYKMPLFLFCAVCLTKPMMGKMLHWSDILKWQIIC